MALNQQFDFLKQAIRANDLIYFHTFPLSECDNLQTPDKIALLKLLRTNIDTFGINTDILEIAKRILKNQHGHDMGLEFRNAVDAFCKELGRKTNDYGRMWYLKGKIEYLKGKVRKVESAGCEKVVDLDQIEE